MLLRPDVPWILTIRDGAGSFSEARASVRTKVLYMGSRQREKKSMIALQSNGFYSIFLLTEKTGNLYHIGTILNENERMKIYGISDRSCNSIFC